LHLRKTFTEPVVAHYAPLGGVVLWALNSKRDQCRRRVVRALVRALSNSEAFQVYAAECPIPYNLRARLEAEVGPLEARMCLGPAP
jgi:hypothetical protein